MWLWLGNCKYHKCLVYVCHSRTNQFAFSRKDCNNISFLLCFIQNLVLYHISY